MLSKYIATCDWGAKICAYVTLTTYQQKKIKVIYWPLYEIKDKNTKEKQKS